jgi:hypothetical protein
MNYLIPAIAAVMLGYMVWLAAFRLRHDRVKTERHRTRGKFAFKPKDRARFLLGRSFEVSKDKPEWEDPLVSSLAKLPIQPKTDDRDRPGDR